MHVLFVAHLETQSCVAALGHFPVSSNTCCLHYVVAVSSPHYCADNLVWLRGCCLCVRDFSRQEYLKKREEKKIEELEADLLDAETIFAGEKLSKKEIEELEYKRTVLDLAKKRKQAQEDLNRDDGYHMPTAYDKDGAAPSERYKVLTERYRCSAIGDSPCCTWYAYCAQQVEHVCLKTQHIACSGPISLHQLLFECRKLGMTMNSDECEHTQKYSMGKCPEVLVLQWQRPLRPNNVGTVRSIHMH